MVKYVKSDIVYIKYRLLEVDCFVQGLRSNYVDSGRY